MSIVIARRLLGDADELDRSRTQQRHTEEEIAYPWCWKVYC
ncbi:hypothetical protein O9993_04350 [Vibrio lentus]|nr:hypothetical protein [Vibrio lentus]